MNLRFDAENEVQLSIYSIKMFMNVLQKGKVPGCLFIFTSNSELFSYKLSVEIVLYFSIFSEERCILSYIYLIQANICIF